MYRNVWIKKKFSQKLTNNNKQQPNNKKNFQYQITKEHYYHKSQTIQKLYHLHINFCTLYIFAGVAKNVEAEP